MAPSSDEIMLMFANSIYEKVALLRKCDNPSPARSVLSDAVKWDIKKASNLLTPRQSVAAATLATKLGIPLSALTWTNQTKFDPKRLKFVLEHFWTVSDLRDRFVAATSAAEIWDDLRTKLMVVWITRDEDALLNIKHRSHRPCPEDAYKQAGIVLAAADAR